MVHATTPRVALGRGAGGIDGDNSCGRMPAAHNSVANVGLRRVPGLGVIQLSGRPVALVALVAFLIIGPYAYLADAIALDFGGKQGSGTASGLIDGVGYLGGVLAGNSMASIAVTWGWNRAYAVLAGVTWLASIAAALYFLHQRKPESIRN